MRTLNLLSFLALFIWNRPAQANEDAYINAYDNSVISPCEMTNLQAHFKTDYYDTKLAIGKTIVEKKNLSAVIKASHKAKEAKKCDFWDHGFQYEDAEVMAQAWGLDIYETKMKLGQYANDNTFKVTRDLVDQNAKRQASTRKPVKKSGFDAYASSKYDYCHAQMIKKSYQVGIVDAKIMLGDAIANNYVESKLNFAREQLAQTSAPPCEFYETRFSYKDAEKIASMWSVSVAEAKASLVNKYIYGVEFSIEKELRR